MYEKTKLLQLFESVKKSAAEAKKDIREIQSSVKLSTQGKKEGQEASRLEYMEAVNKYREDMLQIVDKREEDYIAYYKKTAMDYMRSNDYQSALMTNLDTLRKGYMGIIEVMALTELYSTNDLAMNMICDVMFQTKNPHVNLISDRITIRKQLNAFNSIRNIIKSKVNIGILDRPTGYVSNMDADALWFGSGFQAILEELDEDLTLLRADASLGSQANADKKNQVHSGESVANMKTAQRLKRKNGQKDRDTVKVE